MLLEDAEEKVTSTEKDLATGQDIVKVRKREFQLLYVRGDVVILVSPPLRPT